MRLHTHSIFSLVTLVFLAILFSLASSAHAESVQWNTTFGPQRSYFRDLRYPNGSSPALARHGGWVQFSNTQDQITYHIRVTDADTGEVLAPNADVPISDHVKLEFLPHVYSDIVWFTSGSAQDSPYGYWIAGAAPPPIACNPADQVGGASDGVGPQLIYVAHSVNPPAKTLTVPSGMSCDAPDANGSRVCTFDSPGSFTPRFNWAATNGNFYLRMTSPRFASGCIGSSNSYYNLAIPAQTFDFPLNVSGPVNTGAPGRPTLSAASAASGAAACTVGTPYVVTMSSVDPQGDQIRYAIDWDANGSIDQYVPASGYVPSGTQESATRLYSLVGTKTIKILAQDDQGNSSPWATLSFTCDLPANPVPTQADLGGSVGAGDGNDSGNSFSTDLTLSVLPSLVQKGQTVKVNWGSTNMNTCTIVGENGDSWTALQSILGGNVSKPITGRTVYTLTCLGIDGITKTRSVTVNVLPLFQEQ